MVTVTVACAATLPIVDVDPKKPVTVNVDKLTGIVAIGSPLMLTVSGPVYVFVAMIVEVLVLIGNV